MNFRRRIEPLPILSFSSSVPNSNVEVTIDDYHRTIMDHDQPNHVKKNGWLRRWTNWIKMRRIILGGNGAIHAKTKLKKKKKKTKKHLKNKQRNTRDDDSDDNSTVIVASAPSADYFSNNHVLVNITRNKYRQQSLQPCAGCNSAPSTQGPPMVLPLRRSLFLDSIASLHVQKLAKRRILVPIGRNAKLLQQMLQSNTVGENVLCGTSIRQMHQQITSREVQSMYQLYSKNQTISLCDPLLESNGTAFDYLRRLYYSSHNVKEEEKLQRVKQFSNMVNVEFVEMGMATARCEIDGKLYMVQLFRGKTVT
jgi:hypothetical protein